jgi:hypothetical protein
MTFQSICRTFISFIFILSLTLSALTLQTSATSKDNQTIPLSKFVPKSPVDNQTIPIPQFVPKSPVDNQTIPIPQFVPKPSENIEPINDQFSMTVQFQPYPWAIGWYQVSDWQLGLSNPNRWCPSQNCAFQLSGYLGPGESTQSGGHFWGFLTTNSGDTAKTSNLVADWIAVEERIQGGQTVQVIHGTLTLTTYVASFPTDNQYRISGTLTPYGEGVILAIQGVKE